MTLEEHRERHVELHKCLDELLADYIIHHPGQSGFLSMPLTDLIHWSSTQTCGPDEPNRFCHREVGRKK
jgi:hypothetical protein